MERETANVGASPVKSNRSNSLERLWVKLIDTDLYRKHVKYGFGSRLLRSPVFRSAQRWRHDVTTRLKTWLHPEMFSEVHTYCTFIGHNKSGTTLLGSLIDAHANAILADEADAFQYVTAGFRRDQIYHVLTRASRRDLLKGRVTARRLGGYSYFVPGQWQGRYSRLHVIGDSTSGTTTRRLGNDLDVIRQLRELMPGVQTRFIQVVRNPFDPISAMMVRGKRTFENASGRYFDGCESLVKIRNELPDEEILEMRYEDFILGPEIQLGRVCSFLGLDSPAEYLLGVTSILYKQPDQLRSLVEWQPAWIRQVERQLEAYPFLDGYNFSN